MRYLVDRLEGVRALDPIARAMAAVWDRVLPKNRDLLHGTWLGHPLHPALTDLPIGFWTGACLLDVFGDEGSRTAAERLVGAGVLSALPTIATGAADWVAVGAFDRPKRVGTVHALANATATMLYAASWVARRRGRHGDGVRLGLAGAVMATAGGLLGGHLAYRNALGVDHTAGEPDLDEWTNVGPLRDVPMRVPVRRSVGGADVLLFRHGSTVRAIAATCSHLGGPLDEGEVNEDCVTCPWHGSAFRMTDGAVVRGPATAPQPAYETRVVGRTLQIRLGRGATDERDVTGPGSFSTATLGGAPR